MGMNSSASQLLSLGQYCEVTVSCFESPSNVHVQPKVLREELVALRELLFTVYSLAGEDDLGVKPENCLPGTLVAAIFDNDLSWYRAQILSRDGPSTFVVRFIDYGDVRPVSVFNMKQLLHGLKEMECLAVKCALTSLVEFEASLNPKLRSMFGESLNSDALVAQVDQITPDQVPIITLHEIHKEGDMNVNEKLLSCIRTDLLLQQMPMPALDTANFVLRTSSDAFDHSFVGVDAPLAAGAFLPSTEPPSLADNLHDSTADFSHASTGNTAASSFLADHDQVAVSSFGSYPSDDFVTSSPVHLAAPCQLPLPHDPAVSDQFCLSSGDLPSYSNNYLAFDDQFNNSLVKPNPMTNAFGDSGLLASRAGAMQNAALGYSFHGSDNRNQSITTATYPLSANHGCDYPMQPTMPGLMIPIRGNFSPQMNAQIEQIRSISSASSTSKTISESSGPAVKLQNSLSNGSDAIKQFSCQRRTAPKNGFKSHASGPLASTAFDKAMNSISKSMGDVSVSDETRKPIPSRSFPIEKGTYQVCISHSDGPLSPLHVMLSEDFEKLDSLSERIRKSMERPTLMTQSLLTVGKLVAVRHVALDRWCRGQIKVVDSANDTVSVWLVDVGQEYACSSGSVHPLRADLGRDSCCCFRASLADQPGHKYARKVKHHFMNWIGPPLTAVFGMEVLQRTELDGVVPVKLICRSQGAWDDELERLLTQIDENTKEILASSRASSVSGDGARPFSTFPSRLVSTGLKFLAKITNIDPSQGPGHFFVVDAKESAELDLIDFAELYAEEPEVASTLGLAVGQACVCFYKGDKSWNRAEIVNVGDEGETVDVLFVDYGNTETVSSAELKLMRKEHLKPPPLAIPCRLSGFDRTEFSADKDFTSFNADIISRQQDVDRSLICRLQNVSTKPYQVDFLERSSNGESRTINSELISSLRNS